MSDLNTINIMGNLTKDPEIRYLESGTALTTINIASNKTFMKEGEKKEKTCFVTVTFWGKRAETVASHFDKGSKIIVTGELELSQWETDSGEKRSQHKINAFDFCFLPRGAKSDQSSDKSKNQTPSSKTPQKDDVPF